LRPETKQVCFDDCFEFEMGSITSKRKDEDDDEFVPWKPMLGLWGNSMHLASEKDPHVWQTRTSAVFCSCLHKCPM
jgi:hypothetical protein